MMVVIGLNGQSLLAGSDEVMSDGQYYERLLTEGLMDIAQTPGSCTVPQEFPCHDTENTCLHQRLW